MKKNKYMKLNVIIHVKLVMDQLKVIVLHVHKIQIDNGNLDFVLVNLDL